MSVMKPFYLCGSDFVGSVQNFFTFTSQIFEVMKITERITINQDICHGKPCIRNMRWPVEVIIDMLGSGMSSEEIIEDHPELEKEDILAALNFAKLYLSGQPIENVA